MMLCEGACRCGAVRVQVTAPPLFTMACHCTGCQHMTASAFSLSATVPSDGFRVTQGEPVIGGLHGPEHQQFHCPHCMSWLFTRVTAMPTIVAVRTTMLDADEAWKTPFLETFTNEKLSWAKTPARHSFPKFPPFEAWDSLVQDYAKTRTITAPAGPAA